MSRKTDELTEHYCQVMIDFQQYCEDRDINFRMVIADLIQAYVAEDRARPTDSHGRREPAWTPAFFETK